MEFEKMDYSEWETPVPKSKPARNRQRRVSGPAATMLSYLHDLVFSLIIVFIILFFLFRIVIVSGPSMNRTLLDGDCLILASGILYQTPKQGDIVVACKDDFRNGELIIKRVIATEGQTVRIDYSAGIVYVDDVPLEEPYVNTPTNLEEGSENPQIVKKGHVFVMGDNRNDSMDSRHPDVGQIDCREILGKAVFLFYPGTNNGSEKRQYSRIGVLA